jgi:hypothetical protein
MNDGPDCRYARTIDGVSIAHQAFGIRLFDGPSGPKQAHRNQKEVRMPVNRVLAGLAVNDVDALLPWYDRLLGRPVDVRPMDIVAEYHLPGGVIQLVANADRAGRSLLTLDFADLDAELSAMSERGLDTGSVDDTTSDRVRFTTISDPDGNLITLVQQR